MFVIFLSSNISTINRNAPNFRDFALVILTGDNWGRLLKFDPKTNQVTVLLKNLMFPNGVVLSKNNDFLPVAETTNCRVLKYWLEPSKAGTVEIFAKLPGRPDNIKRNQNGEFGWQLFHWRTCLIHSDR